MVAPCHCEIISQDATELPCNNLFINPRDDLLQESNYNENHKNVNICKCPHINAKIQGIDTSILIDTGSEVTCISEEFFLNNEKAFKDSDRLPINGKKVRVAIGNKTTAIKWQIICTLQITDEIEHMIFLIIPGLTKNAILGYDGQKELKIALFPASDIMSYNNKDIKFNSSSENLKNTEIGSITSGDNSVSETQNNRHCVDHTISLYDVSEALEDEIPSINLLENDESNIVFEEEPDLNEITMEKINAKLMFNKNLNIEQKQLLANLIFENRTVFNKKPGLIKDFEYELHLKDYTPFFIRPYPIPLKYEQKVDMEIEKMLNLGLIRRSNSNYINPVLIVVKKDGSIRICLDCRQINLKLDDDKESPTGIEEIFHKCHGVKYMSALDLTASFW